MDEKLLGIIARLLDYSLRDIHYQFSQLTDGEQRIIGTLHNLESIRAFVLKYQGKE